MTDLIRKSSVLVLLLCLGVLVYYLTQSSKGNTDTEYQVLKEKYLNEYIARDITYYDPKRGPTDAHRGKAINQKIADYFIKGLK